MSSGITIQSGFAKRWEVFMLSSQTNIYIWRKTAENKMQVFHALPLGCLKWPTWKILGPYLGVFLELLAISRWGDNDDDDDDDDKNN